MSLSRSFFVKSLFVWLCMLLISSTAFCQQEQQADKSASAIFLEIGGNAVLYSLNYDRRLFRSHKGLGIRVGASYWPGFGHGGSSSWVLPVGVNYLVGQTHYLEIGAGATFELEQGYTPEQKVYFVPSVGYRYQPLKKGFMFRLAFTPFIGTGVTRITSSGTREEVKLLPWGGLSFGIRL